MNCSTAVPKQKRQSTWGRRVPENSFAIDLEKEVKELRARSQDRPWMARNRIVLGPPAVFSTDGAFAFFNAHNPLAAGTQTAAMNALREPWKALPASDALVKVTLTIQVAEPWPRVCAVSPVAMAEALACSAP